MKIFVFLALASVAMAADLCRGGHNDGMGKIKGDIRNGVNLIFGHCASFDINALVLNGNAPCNNLFRQGYCYGHRAAEHYAGGASWDLIRADIGNMANLGNLLCSDARQCFEAIGAALVDCHEADSGFKDGVYSALEGLYEENAAERVAALSAESEYAVVRQLLQMGMDNVQSLQQVEDFVRSHISDDVRDDARAAFERASQAASDFCDAGCVDQVADFARDLIRFMTKKEGVCENIYPFCGGCADRAAKRINDIPCCLVDVIELGVEGFNYAADKYGDDYENVKSYFQDNLDDAAIAEVQAVVDEARAQFQCVRDVYSNVDGCESA